MSYPESGLWLWCSSGRLAVLYDAVVTLLVYMMRYSSANHFRLCERAPVPFVGAKGTKSAFCSHALSGTVLRVPDAENLKIRP